MKITPKYLNKLYVEGNDDQHVVWSLCDKHKIEETFDVIDSESIDNVFSFLELSVNEQASQIPIVGIVVDADADLNSRWQKITSILNKTGNYTVPANIPADGLVLPSDVAHNPIVGVWIMPDNNINGMLEDFIATLAKVGDPMLPAVDNALDQIEAQGINKYKAIHRAKARIHTFLAWQKDPGVPMGAAITRRYLDPMAPISQKFVDWLNRLFA